MKTLIIGCKGYVGSHLLKANPDLCTGTDRSGRDGFLPLDLARPHLDDLPLDWSLYTHAIVASGISKIGQCEKEPKTTYHCNVEGTLQLARQLTEKKIFPLFFSSDYVFDGSEPSYDELSTLKPLNEYGRQKAILEQEIPKICGDRYLMLRLGKTFGIQPGDKTLFDEMATLLCSGKTVKAAYDQVFTPIYIEDVIQGIFALQQKGAFGLYNLCGDETWSRYDLACLVAKSLSFDLTRIERISLEDLKESFKRPKKLPLKNGKLKNTTGLNLRSIASCIDQLATSYQPMESFPL